VDVESAGFVCQVKHRRVCSLGELERLALELERLGEAEGKAGLVVVKRRAGRGQATPRLVVMTEPGYGAGWCSNSNLSLHATRSSLERGTLWIEKGTLWIGY
jgi:hypothetical protein